MDDCTCSDAVQRPTCTQQRSLWLLPKTILYFQSRRGPVCLCTLCLPQHYDPTKEAAKPQWKKPKKSEDKKPEVKGLVHTYFISSYKDEP
jgi:hypothetical protein